MRHAPKRVARPNAVMKIALSSPDGLGDFVLRAPLVEALLAGGHGLLLVMRPPASELARAMFPEASVVDLSVDPFGAEAKSARDPFAREISEIERFAPDLYVAGAFHPTLFDQHFLEREGARIPCAGFVAEEDLWASGTTCDPRELSRKLSAKARVATALPEVEKNLRLAAAVLGRPAVAAAPRAPSAEALAAARELLRRAGVGDEEFTVVCAGTRPGLAMKEWGQENWSWLLREIAARDPRPLVFLGNTKEAASIDRLISALPSGARSADLSAPPPPVAVSHAIVSLASAYLGRDSGIMHLAAACDVPLVALFTGAHWPRFLPAARRGIVLATQAPCRGCGYHCPFAERWCITTIPRADVLGAWSDLRRASDLEIRELPAPQVWLDEAARHDVAAFVRDGTEAARRSPASGTLSRLRKKIGARWGSPRQTARKHEGES